MGSNGNLSLPGLSKSNRGRTYEVINIGIGGLNTPQEIHILEQVGLQYKPHLVILNFVLNDCDVYSSLKEAAYYSAKADSRIKLFNVPIDPEVK